MQAVQLAFRPSGPRAPASSPAVPLRTTIGLVAQQLAGDQRDHQGEHCGDHENADKFSSVCAASQSWFRRLSAEGITYFVASWELRIKRPPENIPPASLNFHLAQTFTIHGREAKTTSGFATVQVIEITEYQCQVCYAECFSLLSLL